MNSWVRFLNKTSYPVVYVKTNGSSPPVSAIQSILSEYILTFSGSTYFEIYDNRGHLCENIPIFLFPGKCLTIVLK